MQTTLEELSEQMKRIESYLKALIEVNLELIEEVEPEAWEVEDLEERSRDEFIEWRLIKNEL
ncbi:MAG: hypothetical protein QXI54_08415 [Archaeoglobaceae archaeon]|nr:hypothetical protein [Archaeoglobales archaeon]